MTGPDVIRRRPGAELLAGAVDSHIHACPHINGRSLDVFEAVSEAAAAGMSAIGLMDNFANSAGLAALANRHLGHLGVEVFGGLIMEPPAGGVSAEAVEIALRYGYGDGDGARFVSLPTHHTRNVALQEGRSPLFVESCLAIPEAGPLPDPLPRILDLIAAADVVFNTGHVSGPEAVRAAEAAQAAGVRRILAPSAHYDAETVRALAALGAVAEFSFFFVSHATQVGLTHVDAARNRPALVDAGRMAALIAAAGPENAMLNSDCGVFLLPPPAEGLREFLLLLGEAGVAREDLRRMTSDVPRRLFRLGAA
ncbi:DUF6282 family protein [Rubrimonas cliftonensis]|uniref:Uncharacterized protein n=1 Tax=Rubrimonas cliftonensis TaxID=89524 RepID=A0A1H3YNR5_9RHOB|nr:DUF6282 family protein [Rubrimonas cliftonensis]SEA13037.1 hypothetical protein SAMN05444370_103175 [Rubrimonas cliftonensis]